jgi:SAM-dependent methyltransferase
MARFDEYSGSYKEAVEGSIDFCWQGHDFFTRAKVEALARVASLHLSDAPNPRVLDLGCGVGLIAEALAARIGSVEGIDPSEESVEKARERHPEGRYEVFDGARIPREPGLFDMVYAINVFHHVPPSERPALAREMSRVLRPGGLGLILEHNPWNPLTRLAVARCPFDDDAILLGTRETTRHLAAAGLERVEKRFILFFPFDARIFRRAEGALGVLPFGAQYYVAARKETS